MARLRSKQFPEIQRNILKRAAAVFAEIGYASSTITDLTRATGLSRGALYHYFPSKEAILYEILDAQVRGFLDIVEDALQSSAVPVEKLRAVTRAIVEYNTQSPNEQVIVLNEVNQLAAADREKIEGLERCILSRLSELIMQVDGGSAVTPNNRRVYTMMYLGMINYTFAWYNPNGPVKPKEYADLACALILNGLTAKGAAPTGR